MYIKNFIFTLYKSIKIKRSFSILFVLTILTHHSISISISKSEYLDIINKLQESIDSNNSKSFITIFKKHNDDFEVLATYTLRKYPSCKFLSFSQHEFAMAVPDYYQVKEEVIEDGMFKYAPALLLHIKTLLLSSLV